MMKLGPIYSEENVLSTVTISGNRSNDGPISRRKKNSHFKRYRQIALVLVKYRLGDLIRNLGLERFLPFHWIPPVNFWKKLVYSKPQLTRMAMEELGTAFVKVGQILSTRTDLLPQEYARELAKLQDSLKPLPAETMKEVIRKELGRDLEEIFVSFDDNPVGVASIGQVHAASLHDGTEVVIKARKPGVMEQVTEDLDILREMAASTSNKWEGSSQYNLASIVEEISETMIAEMDYVREAHSIEYFANFFKNESTVYIPRVHWQYTTSRIITMDRVRGINILDIEPLDKTGIDRKELAKRCVNLWIKMIFEGDVFHADPHPGNLFLDGEGRLALVDFGMIGMVDEEVREHLANAVTAILERDVDLMVDSLVELGAVSRDGSREALRNDLKHVLGHYPKISIGELPANSNLGELLTVVRRNHVQLPSNTFLLLKTMGMAQSLGKALDPNFEVLPLLEPNVKQVLKEKNSAGAVLRRLPSVVAGLANLSLGLPQRLNRLVRSVERGELQVRTDVSGLEIHIEHLERIINRVVFSIVIAAGFLGITILILAFTVRR
jgi:ubiquinone biosynthesis protein